MTATATPTAAAPSATAAPAPRRRPGRAYAVAASSLVGLVVLSVWWGTGSVMLTPAAAWRALVDPDDAERIEVIATNARLARVVMAIGVGAALGASGALLQALYQNALASPSITGVTQGAVAAAVVWLTFGGASSLDEATWIVPLVATAGGFGAGLLTYIAARLGGRTDPLRLILMGVLVGGVLASITAVTILASGDLGQELIRWTTGSLTGTTWTKVRLLYTGLALLTPLVIISLPLANVLALGDNLAQGLGQRVEWARGVVLFTSAGLVAAAVSFVGGIAFVGLVAPHLTRRATGADLRRHLPAAALVGAGMVAAADFVARNVVPIDVLRWLGVENPQVLASAVPAGIFLALLGAPYFVIILRRTRT
ncbi:MAG: iron ABC transporter permease [Actinomycetota bacterium]